MKKWIFTCIGLLVILLSGCAKNDLTIAVRELTEDESRLIFNAGGDSADHFKINGEIPKGYDLYFVIEQYERGTLIGNPIFPNPVQLTGSDSYVSFAVINDWENPKILYGHPGGRSTYKAKVLGGPSTSGRMIEKEVVIQKEEPVYLAYWVTSSKNSMDAVSTDVVDLQHEELAYLFKAELRKK